MEEQNSIVLQKKMVLTLFMIIFTTMSGIYAVRNNLMQYQEKIVASNNEVIEINTNTVENDIIKIEQIAYAAATEVSETTQEGKEELESKEQEDKKEEKQDIQEKENVVVAKAERNTATQVVSRKGTREDTVKYVSYRELAENDPPVEYRSVVEVSATAYCLCQKCCGKLPSHPSYGYTASGIKIIPGTGMKVIAVDPGIIPLGSKVYVQGLYGAWDYGNAVAGDTGSAIKDHKIDLYMDTHEEALMWGRRNVNVYVVE